jgi:hypothetical protein
MIYNPLEYDPLEFFNTEVNEMILRDSDGKTFRIKLDAIEKIYFENNEIVIKVKNDS